ncbi:hypothetical protein AS149_25515 [Burkholderia cenocepacia]|nr:hypothetical protein AS149_25515 [Burkholderia cenocepacia]
MNVGLTRLTVEIDQNAQTSSCTHFQPDFAAVFLALERGATFTKQRFCAFRHLFAVGCATL